MQNNRIGQHTLVGVEDGWEVLDVAQAVATQRQAGAGEAQPIVLSSTAHTGSLDQICVQMKQMIGLRTISSKGEGRQCFEQDSCMCQEACRGIAPYRHGRTEQGLTTTSKAHFLWKGARGSP